MKSLRESVVSGAVWMISMRLTVQLIGLASSIILARILAPEDFGLVALAGSAYAFFAMAGQFGFDSALIHHKKPAPDHYNAAWTGNILIGIYVSVAMILVAEPAARFFGDARIANIVRAFALLSLLKGFENIGVVNFRRNLEFGGDFLYFVIPKIASFFAGVSAAMLLKTYWALVIGMLGMQLAALVFSYLAQSFRPRLSLLKLKELLRFSKWIVLTSFLGYLSANGIEVLLGKISGPEAVGILVIAVLIASLTSSELIEPINRSLFPSFASISEDSDRFFRVFFQVFGATLLISLPTAFGIIAISSILIDVVFGQKWALVSEVLFILGFTGALKSVCSSFLPALMAQGRPSATTQLMAAKLLIVYPSALFLIPKLGVVGVAYAFLFSEAAGTCLILFIGIRALNLQVSRLIQQAYRPLVASLTMFGVLIYLQQTAGYFADPSKAAIATLIGIGIVIYVSIVAVLWTIWGRSDDVETQLLELATEKIATYFGSENHPREGLK